MSESAGNGVPVEVKIDIPPELEGGVFANFAGIWNDEDGFVIDFAAVAEPPRKAESEAGSEVLHVRARVVSRVRIPPRQAIELMRTLGAHLDQWEKVHGPTK